jgi:hypothetical protein
MIMKPEEPIALEMWVRECFKRENAAEDDYPSFRRLFIQEMDQVNEEFGVNVVVDPSSWIDPEDTESGTCREVERNALVSFQGYLAARKDGHSTAYAEVYGPLIGFRGSEERASESAYRAICKCYQPSSDDPAYQDAYDACIHQDKSKEFAERCATFLYDYDFIFTKAFKAAGKYEEAYHVMRDRGHSELRAKMYAEQMRNEPPTDFAELYAESVEEQIQQGRNQREAEEFAKIHAGILFDYGKTDEDELECKVWELHLRAKAESEYRYQTEYGNKALFLHAFDQIHQRLPRGLHPQLRVWFDEVETRTKQELAEPGSQLGPRGCLQHFKDAEDNIDESEHQPDIQKMSEAEFKSYSPRSEDEQNAYEEEDKYRDWCADRGMDPMDSDSRDLYKEFCAEYDIDDMDDDNRDGWTDNLNKE